jgi:hypothetical protein
MHVNANPSEIVALLGAIDPVSQGVGSVSTGWVPASYFGRFFAVIQTGVLGAGATLDAKLQQATSAAGAGAKDVTGKAITQIVKASGDNKQAMINLRPDELDMNGGFTHIRLTLTVGAAASLVGAQLLGYAAKQLPASAFNPASVVQVVS